jgi:hypothetical protein
MISLSERKTTVAGPKNHTTNYQINIAKFSVHLEYWTSLRWFCNGQQIDVFLNVQFYHRSKKKIFFSRNYSENQILFQQLWWGHFFQKSPILSSWWKWTWKYIDNYIEPTISRENFFEQLGVHLTTQIYPTEILIHLWGGLQTHFRKFWGTKKYHFDQATKSNLLIDLLKLQVQTLFDFSIFSLSVCVSTISLLNWIAKTDSYN